MPVFRFIANQMAPLTLIGAVLAFVWPPLFLIFKDVFLWLFAATMFALGIVLRQQELRATVSEPGKIAAGVLTQYSVMPVLGFAAASSGLVAPEIALGFVIVACAPGAMASNVIVYLAGGAVAYSIALTTVATLLSPLLTPALVKWLGGAFMPVQFWPLMLTIIKTVLVPLLLGMLVRRWLEARHGRQLVLASEIAPAVAALAIIIICSYAVAANVERIREVGGVVIMLVVVVNALGYLLGYGLARVYGFDARHRLTLAIEIGMQNAGLGVALALAHFPPQTALPGALFAFWCVLTAAGASAWLKRRHGHAA
ncbi:MAG: bile acid:sodium symporter family protein [Granulosicoccaceae bacterium]|jgi:BASS family bile acid:Na+ symporter